MISSLELARLCGVSQGTVDRALHGRPGISPATRDRILREASRSGYRPHPAVRELITGVSRTVGAVVPAVNNVFFMDVFESIGRRLRERGLGFQVTPAGTREDFLATLEDFASRRFRVALAIPPEDGIVVPKTVTSCLPVVSLISPCKGERVTFLSPDEEETGREAVRYLHSLGHRRILHLTYDRPAHAIKARARGYRKQCKALGLAAAVLANPNPRTLREAWETSRPTALFCHNDWLAITAMLQLAELGLRVPEDVSVLGVDHSPTLSALHPDLTTLAYPIEAVERAFLEAVEGKTGGETALKAARFRLVEKKTVAAPRS